MTKKEWFAAHKNDGWRPRTSRQYVKAEVERRFGWTPPGKHLRSPKWLCLYEAALNGETDYLEARTSQLKSRQGRRQPNALQNQSDVCDDCGGLRYFGADEQDMCLCDLEDLCHIDN